MKKIFIAIGGIAAGIIGIKAMILMKLKYFNFKEFGFAWPFLSIGLLTKLDEFREKLSYPIIISPVPGSMIRFPGGDEKDDSQHFYGRAIDIMLPQGPSLSEAAEIAVKVGFTGIGVYPMWQPHAGLHLDIRNLPKHKSPATWGGIRLAGETQKYVSLSEALRYAA